LEHDAAMTADPPPMPWWWRLVRSFCFVAAGIAFLVIFVCMASEGEDGETEQENSRQERVCLLVAAPIMIDFGGAGWWLDRAARRRGAR
jgi:hypothetical protein